MTGDDSRPGAPHADMALRLPNTADGQTWLAQFDEGDQALATRALGALTLVSHSAFERALTNLILDEATTRNGPIALYATREADPNLDYFETMVDADNPLAPLDAAPRGADLGSEVRIGNMIRNLVKAHPGKLLNHPSLETLRAERARAILVVDDFIGSGKRTKEFITAMWRSPSIMSWHSRHQIEFSAIAYSGTAMGLWMVRGLKCAPKVAIVRDCPTFGDMPWRDETANAVRRLCDRYGKRTSRRGMRFGFRDTMAALIFEHGCPNNTPSIFWAPWTAKSGWRPLFPDRVVLPEQASAFPPDILARDPVAILSDLADEAEHVTTAVSGAPPLGIATTTVLALVANGVRSRAALGYATGYDARACTDLLDRCIARGYLSPTLRLTAAGRAELAAATVQGGRKLKVPPPGEDAYYPQQLRGLP